MIISIVIPVYNEEATLYNLVHKVVAVSWDKRIHDFEIIIINDGSKDKSFEIMQRLTHENQKIKIFSNDKNMGKSQTVKRGVLETNGDLVIVQDADFEYDPYEINNLVVKMLDDKLDVVYGNRFGKKNKVIYWQNYFGNIFVSFVSNIFTFPRIRKYIPDMEVCYKLIRGDIFREVAKNIESKSNFGIEPELTAKLVRYKLDGKRLKFEIVPISYNPRSIKEGKKIKAFEDGFRAVREIVRYNLL